jgi:flagellar hook assembly protein FlgD
MQPESISQGTTMSVYLNGTGFKDDATLQISDDNGIFISNLNFVGNHQLTFDVYVATYANTGAHDIIVETSNGTGYGYGVFKIDPFLSLDKVEPSLIAQGTNQRDIWIYGTGFKEDTTLSINGGGITINSTHYQNDKLLKAVITVSDSATLGDRKVILTNTNGNKVEKTGILQIIRPITITSIKPQKLGIGIKGATVTITGTEFKDGAELSFTGYGIDISTAIRNSNSQIIALLDIADDASAGTVDIIVQNTDGNSGTGKGLLEIYEEVKVNSLENLDDKVDYVVLQGSSTITKDIKIRGSGFKQTSDGQNPSVSFTMKGVSVNNVTYISVNEIQVNIDIDPTMIMPGESSDVRVTNKDGSTGIGTSLYYSVAELKINILSPSDIAQGAQNITLVVRGQGFVESGIRAVFENPYRDTVTVKNISFLSSNELELTLDVAVNALKGSNAQLRITNKNGDFAITTAGLLRVTDAPIIKTVEPASLQQGVKNQNISITGLSFIPEGATILSFNVSISGGVSLENIIYTSTTINALASIENEAPLGFRNIIVSLTINRGGTISDIEGIGLELFEVTSLPKITAVLPEAVYQNSEKEIELKGAGFSDNSIITINSSGNDIEIIKKKITNSNSITMTIKVSETAKIGFYDITIDNQNGSVGTTKNALEIKEPEIPPSVTNISMKAVPSNSSHDIYVTGSNFQDGISVDIRSSDISISTVAYISGTELKMSITVNDTIPVGYYDIVFNNPDSGVLVMKEAIEIIGQPVINEIQPSEILKSTDMAKIVVFQILGKNFSRNIDPEKIKISGGDIIVDTTSFSFTSSGQIGFSVLVPTYTVAGTRDLEIYNPTNYYTRALGQIKIIEDTGVLIKNVTTSSKIIDFETNVDTSKTKIDFYFELTQTCNVELLIFSAADTNYTYNQEKIVAIYNNLPAGVYNNTNTKISWDGKIGTDIERKVNGSYKYMIKVTSVKDTTITEEYRGISGNFIDVLNVDVVNISSASVVYAASSENMNEPYKIYYTLSKVANVIIEIFDKDGNLIQTFNEMAIQGENIKSWDGRDSNFVKLKKGEYKIKISASDNSGDIAIAKILDISIKSIIEIVSNTVANSTNTTTSDSAQTSDVGEQPEEKISYKVYDSIRVDIEIWSPTSNLILNDGSDNGFHVENGVLVRNYYQNTKAGNTYDLIWDGNNNRGDSLPNGSYMVLLIPKDEKGNILDTPTRTVWTLNKETDINERRKIFRESVYPYPNPVDAKKHRSVKINYALNEVSNLYLYIYDIIGNLVTKKSLHSADVGGGQILWDLRSKRGKEIGRGLYIIVLEAEEKNTGEMLKTTKKMMVIK